MVARVVTHAGPARIRHPGTIFTQWFFENELKAASFGIGSKRWEQERSTKFQERGTRAVGEISQRKLTVTHWRTCFNTTNTTHTLLSEHVGGICVILVA